MFFPVLLQYRWVCFAWHMHDNTIVVYDPCSSSKNICAPQNSYETIAKLLKYAMMLVSSTFFHRWHNDWGNACLEFYTSDGPNPTWLVCGFSIILISVLFFAWYLICSFSGFLCYHYSLNQSGLLCIHFLRCFNGKRLSPPLGMVLFFTSFILLVWFNHFFVA